MADGTLYFGNSTVLYAIDTDSGDELWSHEIEDISSRLMTPTVADGTVFSGGSEPNVIALEATTGDVRWTTDDIGFLGASPDGTVVAGALFLTASGSSLYAINAGVDGSSEDSNAQFGVTGHHHEWAGTIWRSKTDVVSLSRLDDRHLSRPQPM